MISWHFRRAWQEFSTGARPIVTERLRAEAPGRGHWTHTIHGRDTRDERIVWTGSFKPWGFVVRGTRPHDIAPRALVIEGAAALFGRRGYRAEGPRMLRFEAGGRIVFARLVHHPGTRPNRFQFRAWRSALPALKPLLRDAALRGIEIRQPNPYRITLT